MELLTAAEIARRLQIPESTTRYYARRFAAYVPTVGQGRSRRYRAEAVAVLRVVADGMRANLGAETIANQLQEQFPVTALEQQQPTITQQPSVTSWPDDAADQLRIIFADVLSPLVAESEALRLEQVRLREAIADLSEQVRGLREKSEPPTERPRAGPETAEKPPARRPWWRRLFGG